MVAEVADQTGDVVGDKPSDGAVGVHADDPAAGAEHEAGGLKVLRVVVDEGPVAAATARASALWPTGNQSLGRSMFVLAMYR